jgi:chemotaxis signal transduction protein
MSDVVVVDVGQRRLAVASSQAREVAHASWVTPVPTAPPPVAGVTQLRGQILPVLDLGQSPRPVQPEETLLIVEYGPTRAALRVVELLPVDTPAERLDLGALFDSIRAGGP